MIDGSCHCGAIALTFRTAIEPAALPVRLCGCTFCAKHQPRYTSDPAGHLTIRAGSEAVLSRYRFGLQLADFLICRDCGVFVAAFEPAPGLAVLNLLTLADAAAFTAAPTTFTAYDAEDAAARTARRARNWTPAALELAP
jgi:hypothetical protein